MDIYVIIVYTYTNQHTHDCAAHIDMRQRHTNLLAHTLLLRGVSVLTTQPITVVTLGRAPGSGEGTCLVSPAGTAVAIYTATQSSVALLGLRL